MLFSQIFFLVKEILKLMDMLISKLIVYMVRDKLWRSQRVTVLCALYLGVIFFVNVVSEGIIINGVRYRQIINGGFCCESSLTLHPKSPLIQEMTILIGQKHDLIWHLWIIFFAVWLKVWSIKIIYKQFLS